MRSASMPQIGAAHPGVLQQVTDGENGYIASTTKEFAARIVDLLKDAPLAAKIGAAARRSVQERYLLPRYLGDTLRLLNDLRLSPPSMASAGPQGRRPARGVH